MTQRSYIPLPRTRADRKRTKDFRASIAVCYQSRDRYLALVSAAARELRSRVTCSKNDVATLVKPGF